MTPSDDLEVKLQTFLRKINLTEDTMSTVLGGLVVIIVGSLIFNYYRNNQRSEQITPEAAQTTAQVLEASSSASPGPNTYTVAEGDHLWQIAQNVYGNGEYWAEIAQANDLLGPDSITVGQILKLPEIKPVETGTVLSADSTEAIKSDTYIVVLGDTLQSIAVKAYGAEAGWEKIALANNLSNPDQLEAGVVLKIPR